jgi:NDP-sugar pyrophosphorylase family protein
MSLISGVVLELLLEEAKTFRDEAPPSRSATRSSSGAGFSLFNIFLPVPASLEKYVFPALLEFGVYAQQRHGMFIDIGTHREYAYAPAQRLSDSRKAAAKGRLSQSRLRKT